MKKFLNAFKFVLIAFLLVNSSSYIYGQGIITRNSRIKSPTTTNKQTPQAKNLEKRKANKPSGNPTGFIDGHSYVDLGLSVNWATCNLGATTPYEFGTYYAWGEITPKLEYTKENYKYYEGNYKYRNIGSDIKSSAFDAVSYSWSKRWRMPSKAECQELISRCEWIWTSMNNIFGYMIKGPNGNTIFLPASGSYNFNKTHELGLYWTSTYNGDNSMYGEGASAFSFGIYKPYNSSHARLYINKSERYQGYTIRPVCN